MIVEGIPQRSDTITFRSFLNSLDRNPLIIPNNYQRDYTWSRKSRNKDSALEVFLKDFYEALTKGLEFKLIFGNNVCVASDATNQYMELSDGQQRITTLFIFGLLLAQMTNNQRYIQMFYLVSNNRQSELKLQHNAKLWNTFFVNSILNLDTDECLQPIKEAQIQIIKFMERNNFNKENDAEKWFLFVLDNVYINRQCIDINAAEQYFEDVNTKGVVLDIIDKSKSLILSQCSKEKDSKENWQNMIYSVDKLSTVFVNSNFHTLLETVISWGLFISDILDSVAIKDLPKLISEIKDMDKFINLLKHVAEVGFDLRTNSKYSLLQYLNKGNYIPFYYKLVYKYNFSDKEACNYLIYTFLTKEMGNKQSVQEVCNSINSQDLSIKYTPEIFESIEYKKSSPNKKIRAILCLLESQFNPEIIYSDISSKFCTIEHISSQQFKEEGFNSLGNLTLLSKSDNSKLNSKQEKYLIYRNSEFEITKSLCIDYIPNNDEFRMFRSKYLPGYNSQSIDSFNKNDFKLRQRNIYNALIEILNLKYHD